VHPDEFALGDVETVAYGMFGRLSGFEAPLLMPESLRQATAAAGSVVVVDAEGVPIAHVEAGGTVRALGGHHSGPFRQLLRRPDDLPDLGPGPRLTVLLDRPLTMHETMRLRALEGSVLLLVRTVGSRVPPTVLVRSTLCPCRRAVWSR
jgi:hypothetical protein